MLNNSMAELGCDRPEIILKLARNQIPAGETLLGSFLFWREFMERTDTAIEVEFVLKAQLNDEVIEEKIDEFQTEKPWTSEDGQIVEFSFSYEIPQWLPVSTHAIRYYVRPKLSLNEPTRSAEEFLNLEAIIVQPNQDQVRVLQALHKLGFQEKLDSRYWNGRYQEFDFTAGKESSFGIRELTVLFHPEQDSTQVHLYPDQREPISFTLPENQDLVASLGKVFLHR
ncbi:sporulation protein [Effusibacillus consociatus]|uniref:Sporulation protein n=1 Tax=Effusibacillus consociatus TaxID=1117041 RepID=A0ABV9Q5T6_9BACL